MTGSAFRAVAPVSAVCAAFAAQPSAYPPNTRKPDVAPPCGSVGKTLAQSERGNMKSRLQQTQEMPEWEKSRDFERCGGKAGEKAWRFSAPAHPLLPAVRAVLGDKNGAFLRE